MLRIRLPLVAGTEMIRLLKQRRLLQLPTLAKLQANGQFASELAVWHMSK